MIDGVIIDGITAVASLPLWLIAVLVVIGYGVYLLWYVILFPSVWQLPLKQKGRIRKITIFIRFF